MILRNIESVGVNVLIVNLNIDSVNFVFMNALKKVVLLKDKLFAWTRKTKNKFVEKTPKVKGSIANVFKKHTNIAPIYNYTSVKKLCRVKYGQDLDTVIQILETTPYDVLSSQSDGYSIYLFKYQQDKRSTPDAVVSPSGEHVANHENREVYNSKLDDAILFFKDGKFDSLITEKGQKESSSWILLSNTMRQITNDKEKYILESFKR